MLADIKLSVVAKNYLKNYFLEIKNKIFKGNQYDDLFFNQQKNNAYLAAQKIVPLILRVTEAKSIVDVGCGIGAWLKVFQENGLSDFLGIDGHYLKTENLLIPSANFLAQDLTEKFTLNRKFDLALCLEVAEHLPKKKARLFINNLVNLADIIVFSAAIPKQGGTHHLNEQWPGYWQRLFKEFHYEFLDPFRPEILYATDLDYCYRQNIFLALKSELAATKKFKNYSQPGEFLIINSVIFKRNKPFLRLRYLLNKYLFKKDWDV